MFDQPHGFQKLSHSPKNTKKLPAAYLIIITKGVGYHLNHQMWMSITKKGTTMGSPSCSVGAFFLTQGLCSEISRAQLSILISNPGLTKTSRRANGEGVLLQEAKG